MSDEKRQGSAGSENRVRLDNWVFNVGVGAMHELLSCLVITFSSLLCA